MQATKHADRVGRCPARSTAARRTPGAAVSCLAVAIALVACSAAQGEPGAPDASGPMAEIQNQTQYDVSVYVLPLGGSRRLLGTVTSQGTRTYQLPLAVVGWQEDFRLVADPVGPTRVYETRSVRVSPGQSVVWRIHDNAAVSNLIVRGTPRNP